MKSPQQPNEYIYNSFGRLVARSMTLDWEWVRTPAIPQKYIFLVKKYAFLIASSFFWDKQTQSYQIHIWGRTLHLENREHIGIVQSTFVNNAYLKETVRPQGIIIDIGAHTGEFALFCDIYLNAQKIYSFEPVQHSYELLTYNKKKDTYHTAIGTKDSIVIHIPSHSAMASSLPSSPNNPQEIAPSILLDSLPEIQALPKIDLLKIDVEGMEYDVLIASKRTLPKTQNLLMEISIDRSATKPAMDTISYLHSIAPTFQLFHIGQIFGDFMYTDSVDFLFRNTTL